MKISTHQETDKLKSFIEDTHTGDYRSVSRDLYRAINYLHYLESGSVGIIELRNTCFTLHQLAECFFEAKRSKERTKDESTKHPEPAVTADDLWVCQL